MGNCFNQGQDHPFLGKEIDSIGKKPEIGVIFLNLFLASWKRPGLFEGVMSSQESLMIHVPALCSKYKMCLTAASLHIQWEAGQLIFCILAAWGTAATSSFKVYLCRSLIIIYEMETDLKKKMNTVCFCCTWPDTLACQRNNGLLLQKTDEFVQFNWFVSLQLKVLHPYESQVSGLYNFLLNQILCELNGKNRKKLLWILMNTKWHYYLK